MEELWRDRDGAPEPPEGLRVLWLQGAARAHRSLQRVAPDRVSAFRRRLEAYDAECEKAGLAAGQLSRWYTPKSVARYVVSEGLSLLFGLPLAILGLLVHGLPYRLTAFAVRRIPHTDEEEATDKIVGGLVFYPLCWIAEGWAVHALFGRSRPDRVPDRHSADRVSRARLVRAPPAREEGGGRVRALSLGPRRFSAGCGRSAAELSDELHALAALAESGGGGSA